MNLDFFLANFKYFYITIILASTVIRGIYQDRQNLYLNEPKSIRWALFKGFVNGHIFILSIWVGLMITQQLFYGC